MSQLATAQEPNPSHEEVAARLFDEGLVRFQRHDYAGAAQAFLTADSLVPNTEALKDAITTALRAQDPMLIARATDRALRRRALNEEEAKAARTALADALKQVASIDVQCAPAPCTMLLDGAAVDATTVYALPGDHAIVSRGEHGMKASAQLSCVAGASYRVTLQLTPADAAKPPPTASKPPARPAARSAPARSTQLAHAAQKPLAPAIFIAGAGATLALAGLTTWSGLEALAARDLHESNPDAYDPAHVRTWQRRTDYLLLGAVVLGLATGAAGLFWVDWGGDRPSPVSIAPHGLGLRADIRF